MFQLPIEYTPAQEYTRQEMINLIKPHAHLLCFFAKMGGERRCTLGLDFDNYDPTRQMIPVHLIPPGAVKELLIPLHGKRFKRAYQSSRIGRSIIITFQSRQAAGWFKMGWQLDETMVFTSE
jgi:hypothetical protein